MIEIRPKFIKYFFLKTVDTDVIYTFTNLTKFCTSHNLDAWALVKVINGHAKTYKNWCLPETKTEDLWIWVKNQNNETFRIQMGNIKQFCKEMGLSVECIRRVVINKQKQHRGWTKAGPPIDYQI